MTMRPFPLSRRAALAGASSALSFTASRSWACHEKGHPCTTQVVTTLSGPLEVLGRQVAAGVEAVRQQYSETEPNGRGQLRAVTSDSRGVPEQASAQVQEALTVFKATAVIAADFVLSLPRLEELATKFAVPILAMAEPGEKRSDWVFALVPGLARAGNALRGYVAALGGNKKVDFYATPARAERARTLVRSAGLTVDNEVALEPSPQAMRARLRSELPKAGSAALALLSISALDAAALADELRLLSTTTRIVLDSVLATPEAVLRGTDPSRLVLLSAYAPEVVAGSGFARAIDARVRKSLDTGLTPLSALAGTAWQLVASAVANAKFGTISEGAAVRDALTAITIPAEEALLPGCALRIADGALDSQVVALGMREGRVTTVWAPG